MVILTNLSTYVTKLIGIWTTLTKTITSPDRLSKGNVTSQTPYLPWWDVKTIEVVVLDVGDIFSGRQTCSDKQQASVSMMTQILDIAILNITQMHKGNLDGSRLCDMRWILWRRITLGTQFLDFKESTFSNINGFIRPNLPLNVLLSIIRIVWL